MVDAWPIRIWFVIANRQPIVHVNQRVFVPVETHLKEKIAEMGAAACWGLVTGNK